MNAKIPNQKSKSQLNIEESDEKNSLSSIDAYTKEHATAEQDIPMAKFSAAVAPMVNTLTLDPQALRNIAAVRAQESGQIREKLGLNGVKPNLENQQQQPIDKGKTKQAASLKKPEKPEATQTVFNERSMPSNKVEPDEIFTASETNAKLLVPSEIEKRYLRVGDKFYYSKNTDLVAFEDKGNKLETKSNSENIVESMVRIAQARGWNKIKVSGSEAFRKEVWLEAALRGMHVKGYSPSDRDKVALSKKVIEPDTNTILKDNKPLHTYEKETEEIRTKPADTINPKTTFEQKKTNNHNKNMAETFAKETSAEAVKKYPELAGATAVIAIMKKIVEVGGLTEQQRAIVSAHVRKNLVNSIELGDIPKIMVKENVEVKLEANTDKEYDR